MYLLDEWSSRCLPSNIYLPICVASQTLRTTFSYTSYPGYVRTDKMTIMTRFARLMFQCKLPVTIARNGEKFALQSAVLHVNLFQEPYVPATDVAFASIHRFTDTRAVIRDGAGFAVNYADQRRALDFDLVPI